MGLQRLTDHCGKSAESAHDTDWEARKGWGERRRWRLQHPRRFHQGPAEGVLGLVRRLALLGVLVLEVAEDSGPQHFAELHALLVERVDVPDEPLVSDLVLVEREQGTE